MEVRGLNHSATTAPLANNTKFQTKLSVCNHQFVDLYKRLTNLIVQLLTFEWDTTFHLVFICNKQYSCSSYLVIMRTLGPWKLSCYLFYLVSHYIRLKKKRNIKSWTSKITLLEQGFVISDIFILKRVPLYFFSKTIDSNQSMHNELEFWLSALYEIQINPVYQNMMHHAVPQGTPGYCVVWRHLAPARSKIM